MMTSPKKDTNTSQYSPIVFVQNYGKIISTVQIIS